MTDYLFLTLAVLLLAGCFAMSRFYQQHEGTALKTGFRYTCLLGGFTTLIFLGLCGFRVPLAPFSILMASAISTLVILYTLVGFRLMRSGGLALYTMFLMAGGMIVPYVWGLLFWDEEFSLLRTAGLALLIGALILSNFAGKGQKVKPTQLLMCTAVFFLNGFTSVFGKLHQTETDLLTVSADEFVLLSAAMKFLLAGLAWLVCSLAIQKKDPPAESASAPKLKLWSLLAVILIAALFDGVSYMLQLSAASNLPATVQYPFVTGGSTIISALVGMIFFREKPSRAVVLSLILCFAGTLLFL